MKLGILAVSFGTSYEDARKSCIDPVEARIAEAFSDYEVRRAFTSRRIVKKLKERDGLNIDLEAEAIDKMVAEGFEKILVQPLHIMPGYEYEKVYRAVVMARHRHSAEILLGEPLIYCEADYERVVAALDESLKGIDACGEHDGWLFMGHGTEHYANAVYSCLQMHFDMMRRPYHIAALESFPNLDHTIPALRSRDMKRVCLMPFMLVAGDHAKNDMAGNDESSWVNRMTDAGFSATPVLQGLGSMTPFQKLFVEKVRKLAEGVDNHDA